MTSKSALLWMTVFVTCSIAASQPQNESAPQGQPRIRFALQPVRYAEKPAALRTIAGFLPRLLEASLYRYGWLEVVLESSPVQREIAGESPARRSGFLIEISLVGVRDQFRLDLSATDAASGAMAFGGHAVFSEATLMAEVASLAERLADALARRVGATAQRPASIAVVSPFRTEGDVGRLQTLSTLLPEIVATQLSRERISGVHFRRVSQPAAPGEFDGTLTGWYSAAGGLLTVSASVEERRGPKVRFTFRMPSRDAFHAPDYLARRVSELIRGRITRTGSWREEPEWTAVNAGYESFLRRAEEYLNNGERLPAIVFYRKSLEVRPAEPAPRIGLAEIYMATKDYAAALNEYQAVLRDRPTFPHAIYGTGGVYLAQGQNEQAAAAFRSALELAPDDPAIRIGSYKGLGNIEFLQGRNDRALEYYARAQKIAEAANVVDVEIYRSAANAYRAAKRTGEAIAYLENAARRMGSKTELKNELATVYNAQGEDLLGRGQYGEARKAFERALQAAPGDETARATALGGVGVCAAVDGEPAEALDYLQKAAAVMPAREQYRRAMGYAYRRLKKDDKAIEEYNAAIAIEPTYYSYLLLADAYTALKQPGPAEATIKQALRLRPDDYVSHVYLGRLLRDQGKADLAMEAFRKAIAVERDKAEPYRELAWMYVVAKDFRQAIELQKKAAQLSSESEDYWRLGSYYRQNNDRENALGPLRKAIELDRACGKNCRNAYLAIRDICKDANRRAEYVSLLEQGLRINPSHGWLLETAGEAYLEDGRYDDAIRILKRAVVVATGSEAHILLGRAYGKAGQPELAIIVLQQGIRANTEANGLYNELAETHASSGDRNSFTDFLRTLVAEKPESVTAHVRLADKLRSAGEFDEAIPLLRKAIALDPKNEWPHRVLGYAFINRENYSNAAREFERAIGLKPTASSFCGLANAYYSTREYDKAIENADRALKIDSKYTRAYMVKADVLRSQKEPQDAVAVLRAGRAELPRSADLAGSIAISYFDLRDFTEAEKWAREALTLVPRLGFPHYVLARIEQEKKAYERALEEVSKAIEYDAGYENNYALARALYHELGRDAEGVKVLRAHLDKSPNNIGLLLALGFAEHEYVSDLEAAYVHHARAYELAPQRLAVRENFAEANLTAGRFAEAQKLAKAVLQDRTLSPQQKLSMSLISISALLFQGQRGAAFSELGQFFRDYRVIPAEYERSWVYEGTKKYIRESTRVTQPEKNLLLGLIAILESRDRKEGQGTADRLESSLEQIFVDLRAEAKTTSQIG